MPARMTAHLVADALVTAIRRRDWPDALLHHSEEDRYIRARRSSG